MPDLGFSGLKVLNVLTGRQSGRVHEMGSDWYLSEGSDRTIVTKTVRRLLHQGLVVVENGSLVPTAAGSETARSAP